MFINFLLRNTKCGFSIQGVFITILGELQKPKYNLKISQLEMPSPKSMPWDIICNAWFTYQNREKDGINHITGHIHDVILGLLGCKTVLTIHDLVFLDNVKNPIKKFYKWLFWLYIPVKVANKVTCISEQTRKNILKHVKIEGDKLIVIHNPVNPNFSYHHKNFNQVKPTILHIGTGWNKNLKRTIQALQGIPCHLRIIGKLNDEMLADLEKNKIEFSNKFNLTDDKIRSEYINCDIVNFPSEYEGFGMPIVEGQKTGRVVITSNIEPLIEVSGNAVHFVNPFDTNDLRAGYLKIIQNEEYRNGLIEKGLANVRRFEVKLIAKQYFDLYKKLSNNDGKKFCF